VDVGLQKKPSSHGLGMRFERVKINQPKNLKPTQP